MIINELLQYAPPDDKLLAIPYATNIADPFFSFCMQTANKDPKKNNLLVGMNLLPYAQYANQTLAKAYAAGQYIMKKREIPMPNNPTQSEIDRQIYIRSCIIHECQFSLREFISMLRVIVDQMIILLPLGLKNNKNCDSIGTFLGAISKSENDYWDDNRKFLVGLNAAANYLKHHPYQFEEPSRMLHLTPPSLLIVVNNSDKDSGCLNLKDYFADQLQFSSDRRHILGLIGCDFLVIGFNEFYKKFNAQMDTSSKT